MHPNDKVTSIPWAAGIRFGIDVVSVTRLERRLKEWPGLLQRLFTPEEISYAGSRPHPTEHLAVRFAAKEATFKALGSGWPMLSWQEVEVVSDGGRPQLRLSGRVERRAENLLPSVSLSHDGGLAVAQVMLFPAG